jgi:glycosyltransferase involved in cell wall biosynthesis
MEACNHRLGNRLDREVVFDISLLPWRLFRATPTGIDRVNASFATRFLAADAPNRKALLFTPLGPRAIHGRAARRIFENVQNHWREEERPEAGSEFLRVRAALADPASRPIRSRRLSSPPSFRRLKQPLEAGARSLKAGARAALFHTCAWAQMAPIATNAVYLNVCQWPLAVPSYFRWLQKRPDVKPVFMIHDLLPIEHPEFFRPKQLGIHLRKLDVVAQLGAGAIVATATVAEALLAHLAKLGRNTMPIIVAPPPVSSTFCQPREHDEELAARPYFIICGTIEPRKNHLLLFNLWRQLARSMGSKTPKLIVAGARGWENENALDMLDRCPELGAHVIEASGLSTPAIKRLLDNARALLMPSFAEGYGFPVVEALAAGTPVLAADLPSFHAMGEGRLARLDPLDGLGWLAAIRRLSEAPARWEQTRQACSSEQSYFEEIESFLSRL